MTFKHLFKMFTFTQAFLDSEMFNFCFVRGSFSFEIYTCVFTHFWTVTLLNVVYVFIVGVAFLWQTAEFF